MQHDKLLHDKLTSFEMPMKKMYSFVMLFSILLGIKFRLNIQDLTEKEKCPACFGISMCRDIRNIDLDFSDFSSIFNNLFGIKNVYYGSYKNRRVVMKKLATRAEWTALDEMVCASTDINKACSYNNQVQTDFNALVASELINSNFTDLNVKMRLCPGIEKVNKLLQNLGRGHDVDHLKHVWTMLKLNPEPIILEILNANDNWPTPKYFGACGRLIIQEFIGPPMSAFAAASWIERAKIASSLLDAAHLLTYKNQDFAFYPTDISMDNIAVNEAHEAFFVDLENIVIVDKNPPAKVLSRLGAWNEIHSNKIDAECQDCLVFSPSDMCEHKISDHNYYAICRHILVQDGHGFLRNPPQYIVEKYPILKHLLKECSMPGGHHARIDSGIELKQILDTIIKEVKN